MLSCRRADWRGDRANENSLLPVVDVPEFVESENEYDTTYRPSVAWDLSRGDFVRSGSNRVPMSEGKEAYKIWCVKAVATQRYSCLAYPDDIGSELEEARTEPDQGAVELAIARTIQDTLLVNPRTQSVENFVFEWDASGDSVHVTFTVKAIDAEPFTAGTTVETEGGENG